MTKRVVLASMAMLGLCCLVSAASQGERRSDDDGMITPDRFVLKASGAGIAEVAHAKLALQKGSADVRKLAQQLMDDHTKANKQLMQIAESKQIPVARDMDRKHQDMQQKLAALSGAEFDREYIMSQVKSHEEGIALFSKFAENGKDSELKSFAAQTLPTLKEHYKMVKDLADRVK